MALLISYHQYVLNQCFFIIIIPIENLSWRQNETPQAQLFLLEITEYVLNHVGTIRLM